MTAAFHHHNQIQIAQSNPVLAKRFPYDSFDTVPACCSGKHLFAHNYSESGIFFAVAHKKNLEVRLCYISCANNMVKTDIAQQPVRISELGCMATRLRVLHGPWHGAH
jgi:hypothetical protein